MGGALNRKHLPVLLIFWVIDNVLTQPQQQTDGLLDICGRIVSVVQQLTVEQFPDLQPRRVVLMLFMYDLGSAIELCLTLLEGPGPQIYRVCTSH